MPPPELKERPVEPKSLFSRLRAVHRTRSLIVSKTDPVGIPSPTPKDSRIVHSHEDTCSVPRAGVFFANSDPNSENGSMEVFDENKQPKFLPFKSSIRSRNGTPPKSPIRSDSFKRRSVRVTANGVDTSSNNLLREHWNVDCTGRRRVLIAIDHKTNSERAFRWYLDYMIEPFDRVLLVHITEPCISIGAGLAPTRIVDSNRDSKMYLHKCQSLFDRYLERARDSGVEHQIECHIYLNWRPAEGLVAVCKTLRADVIVLGSRGTVHSTGLRGLFLGSVLRYILNHSDIPVTVVPPYDVTPSQEEAQCKMAKKKVASKKK